jgi:hypothetical protein
VTAWSAFLDRVEDARPMAAVRVAIALVVLGSVASIALVPSRWPLWLDVAHGGLVDVPGSAVYRWVGASPATLAAGVALSAGSAIAWTALLALQAWLALADLDPRAGGAYDELLANGLWLLVLAGGTSTWSVDAWRRTGRFAPPGATAPVWGRFLVTWQMALVYASSGWHKVSAHWVPGGDASAVYDILQQPTWQRFDATWAAWAFPATQVATTVVWAFEVGAPLWLLATWLTLDRGRRWATWVRVGFAAVGLGMHVGVEIALAVGSFTWASLAFWPAWVHGREVAERAG